MFSKPLSIITGKENSILRKQNKVLPVIGAKEKNLIRQMFAKMEEMDGIGLAAPQVGENVMVFVVDKLGFNRERSKWIFEGASEPDLSSGLAFINPRIAAFPKPFEGMIEGCLSLPGWEGNLIRSKRVNIKAQNEEGKNFTLRARGLLAKILQHEYDHLQGVLIADKWENPRQVNKNKRIKTSDRYRSIVFFGSPPYADFVLKKLIEAGIRPLVIKKDAMSMLKNPSYDVGILAAYGKILPRSVLQKFKYGILNIHPSLLPKYRGPSPVQHTIINGDKKSGATIIKLSEKMDAGPILAQKEITIGTSLTTGELSEVLFNEGTKLLLDHLSAYLKGDVVLKAQDENFASYTSLIKKEDAQINWQEDALLIERKIRAYQPWPIAFTFFYHHGIKKRLQILEAEIIEKNEGGFIVPCGKGKLLLKKVRPEGKNAMSGEEFLRGYHSPKFE